MEVKENKKTEYIIKITSKSGATFEFKQVADSLEEAKKKIAEDLAYVRNVILTK